MPYNVELCYGYFEGECGIYHAFRLVAPEKDFPDDVEKSLAESLETKADNPNFKWDCMHLNLPDAIVERIKADGVREYLTAQKGEHQDIQRSVEPAKRSCERNLPDEVYQGVGPCRSYSFSPDQSQR